MTLVSLMFLTAALLYADIARYNCCCCCFADECRLVFLSRIIQTVVSVWLSFFPVVWLCLETLRGRLLLSGSRKIMNVVCLYGRCPASMLKTFFTDIMVHIYALTLSNVACWFFFLMSRCLFPLIPVLMPFLWYLLVQSSKLTFNNNWRQFIETWFF